MVAVNNVNIFNCFIYGLYKTSECTRKRLMFLEMLANLFVAFVVQCIFSLNVNI